MARPERPRGWQRLPDVYDLKNAIWRPLAAQALFIARENVKAALRFLDCAERTIKSIAAFPSSGAPFSTSNPNLQHLRMNLVQAFPQHVVFSSSAVSTPPGRKPRERLRSPGCGRESPRRESSTGNLK